MKKILQKFFKEEDANVTIQALIFMAAGVTVIGALFMGVGGFSSGDGKDGLVEEYDKLEDRNSGMIAASVDKETNDCWDWWNKGNDDATRLNADKERNCE